MKFIYSLLLFVYLTLGIGLISADQSSKYPFSDILFEEEDQYYALHWSFSREKKTIAFKVNVSTTGWVGFGLSPNGLMPGSDVVMGWVDGNKGFFHDRFAQRRELPLIDTSQDWFLTSSKEETGFTILEFSRSLTSCDLQDMDISSSTARVVWSYSFVDPKDSSGSDALSHKHQGSRSINLIGGLPRDTAALKEEPYIDITVDYVIIPRRSDTTYWCSTHKLSSKLVKTTHYINRVVPIITPDTRSFVHHIIVYLCRDVFSTEEANLSQRCETLTGSPAKCRFEVVLGGWAVGGEGFALPEGVALPIGGVGLELYVLLEIHYDNSNFANIMRPDNSGLRFYYTLTEPTNMAGSLVLGYAVTTSMFIPPRAENFTIASICPSSCTNSFIPPDGIRIFVNFFHTHLAGRQVELEHYRVTSAGEVVELEPIDQNLNYDFNLQQYLLLPREHIILPGGYSTHEEMCLTYPIFYPRSPNLNSLASCFSTTKNDSYRDFLNFSNITYSDFQADPVEVLNHLDWENNTGLARKLQDSVNNGMKIGICESEVGKRQKFAEPGVIVDISYEPPGRCNSANPIASLLSKMFLPLPLILILPINYML